MLLLLLLLPAAIAATLPTIPDVNTVIDLQELLQKVEDSYRDFGQDIKDLGTDVISNVKLVIQNVNANSQRSDANIITLMKILNDNAKRSDDNADDNALRANANADANAERANVNAKMIVKSVNRVEDRLEGNTVVLKQILEAIETLVNETVVGVSTTTTTTTTTPPTTPTVVQGQDCADLYNKGERSSGPQFITISGTKERHRVFCDMHTDGGGWTVFQRRGDFGLPKDYFSRNWIDYKRGFGDVEKEFWLGNDRLSAMTKQKNYVLRVDLRDLEWNQVYAKYSHFQVDDEQQLYKLSISGYSGNAGDSMITTEITQTSNNMAFTTKDKDNDKYEKDCSEWMGGGGWWYNSCTQTNLNAPNLRGTITNHQAIFWFHWKNSWYSLDHVEMKIRPANFKSNV